MKLFVQKLPNSSEIVLEMIIIVYCGDKSYANPAANKSEYIREGYALRKSLKGLKYKR